MVVRVILADDHRILREGLSSMLQAEPDIEVVAEASDGRIAAELTEKLQPDVIVMDLGMPHLNGVEATRQIISRCPNVKVLILSMHSDKRYVSEALGAGASGYLLKDSAFDELTDAIRSVASSIAHDLLHVL